MACVNNMYNQDHHHHHKSHNHGTHHLMAGPRISFSSDFVLDSSGGASIKHERAPPLPLDPGAPDFEFSSASAGGSGSAGHCPMIAADEVFFKGRILPLKEKLQKMTLREELLAGDGEVEGGGKGGGGGGRKPSKTVVRWKELLGLRKSPPAPKRSQEVMVEEGRTCG